MIINGTMRSDRFETRFVQSWRDGKLKRNWIPNLNQFADIFSRWTNNNLLKYIYIYIYIYIYNHHHHHVVPPARISLTLSCLFSLSFIASGRSSGLSPHSCSMYVRAGRPPLARPYVHRRTSLMSSFLPLQQCPACVVRLTWIVFVMGGRWLYIWCLVGCCFQDLFNIARNILV